MLDQDIIFAFQAGDESAFDMLVEKYQDTILKGCYRFLGNYPDSQDAAQEVFLKAYFALNRFSPDAQFITWLHRILVNHCLNVLRSKKRKSLMWFGDKTEKVNEDSIVSKEKNPLENLANNDRNKAVHNALAKLDKKQRVAIILHKFQGLAYKEIAEIQKCSVSAIEARIHRGKRKLAVLLKELENE